MRTVAAPTVSVSDHNRPSWKAWALLTPMVVWLVLFVVIPGAIMFVYSFCERDEVGGVIFSFTLHNYTRVFDPVYLRIFARSIGYAAATTALCGSEYEWGVHIALFASHAGFDGPQVASLATGQAQDACWTEEDRLLLALCDMLHAECDVDDALWQSLQSAFSAEGILELLMLAGFYRTVSYLTNALRLPAEPGTPGFPLPARRRSADGR